jgi:hypothetical protein
MYKLLLNKYYYKYYLYMSSVFILFFLLILIIFIYYFKFNIIDSFDNINTCDLSNMDLNELEILDNDPVYIKLLHKLIKNNNSNISSDDLKIITNRFQFYKLNPDKINYHNITKKILFDCKLILNENNFINNSTRDPLIINQLYNNNLHNNIITSFNFHPSNISKFFSIPKISYSYPLYSTNTNTINQTNIEDKSDILELKIDDEDLKKLEDIKRCYRSDYEEMEKKNYNKYYYDIDGKKIDFDIKKEYMNYFINNAECDDKKN